jgi:sodium/bile acid cotransporter 7
MRRSFIDPFVIAIAVIVFIAYLLPYPGTKESPFHLDEIANACVSLIFLLYGVQLGPEKLKAGLTNAKLHLVIHASTFILFPLILILLKPLFHTALLQQIWLPFFFLAALPSTVSSAVVMVSIAGGNIPAAIFNASVSSMLGVFITPLWMSIFLKQSGNIQLGSIIIKLLLQVLFPVIIGLLLHKKFGKLAETNKKRLKIFDQSVILLIIYCSFSESFYEGVFKNFDALYLLEILLMATALLFVVYGIITIITKALHFERKDQITATFCGSKKSLVHGTVMSKVLFANAASAGLILLPLMIYHSLQLLIISIIAGKIQRVSSKSVTT